MLRLTMLMLLALSTTSFAQHAQPYAGLQERPVKALSEREVADLRAGRGMGLALAAELNGYPGPLHVLEHADALRLTPEQRGRTQALFEAMKADAVPLGHTLIEQEAALDRAFADRNMTPEMLTRLTAAIGATQAALREAHLKYHLMQSEILTPAQRERYAMLRGYAGGGHQSHDPQRHHGHGGRH
jgi:Spy/CpxP family protein refolding chaperone